MRLSCWPSISMVMPVARLRSPNRRTCRFLRSPTPNSRWVVYAASMDPPLTLLVDRDGRVCGAWAGDTNSMPELARQIKELQSQ
jgi:hypothetical protein